MSYAGVGLIIKHWGNSYTYVTALPLWENSRDSRVPEGEEKINKSDHQAYLYMRKQDHGVKQFNRCHKSCWWQWHHPSWQSHSRCFTFPPLDLPQLFDFMLNKTAVSLSLSPIDSSISCWHLWGANHPDIWEPAVRAGLIGTEETSQSLGAPFPFMCDCEMQQIGRLIERQHLSTLWVYRRHTEMWSHHLDSSEVPRVIGVTSLSYPMGQDLKLILSPLLAYLSEK